MIPRRLGTLSGALVLVLACDGDVHESSPAGACADGARCESMSALVAMSDTSSSGVGAVSVAAGAAPTSFFGVDLGKDPALAVSRGRAFFVARDLDAIFEVSPRCGQPLCRYSTRHAGREGTTNPQDVAVAPDSTLWVPRFGLADVAVVDARGEIATIALPDLDGDGNPNASAIRIVDLGGAAKAFVALERLDDRDPKFRSRGPSSLAVIDVASRAFERTVALRGRNPFNVIVEANGAFYLTDAGNFDDAAEVDAGIERIDPRAPDEGGWLLAEPELGGSPSAVAVDGECGAAIIADPTLVNATAVVTFDATLGRPLRTPTHNGALFGPTSGFDLWAIAWSEGKLLVGDRRRAGAGYPIHVFERGPGCELTERATPLYVAQKPVALRARP